MAPDLVPIVRQGVVSWLSDRLNDAIDGLMDTIMAPVRQATGAIETVRGLFSDLIDWIRMAAARLAKGDCGALSEARRVGAASARAIAGVEVILSATCAITVPRPTSTAARNMMLRIRNPLPNANRRNRNRARNAATVRTGRRTRMLFSRKG